MARNDVLDQRQTQTRSTLGAARADIRPVESLRQAWQVLTGYAPTVITHPQARLIPLLGKRDLDVCVLFRQ